MEIYLATKIFSNLYYSVKITSVSSLVVSLGKALTGSEPLFCAPPTDSEDRKSPFAAWSRYLDK